MSGFAAIVHFDDAPVSSELTNDVARSLRFRAPDGEQIASQAGVALAYAEMTIDGDPRPAVRPLCLDDRWWIVAHVRLYERDELVRALRGSGVDAHLDQPDAWLLLLAVRAWGPQGLARLQGDYSFAIWDARERELVCATDPFGSRPLFYLRRGDKTYVSNTLTTLSRIDEQASELDEQFVADFLCFEFSATLDATVFRSIRRVPPAHFVVVRGEGEPIVHRYWSPPEPALDLTRTDADTLAEFRHVLERAVADRLPSGPASLALSGGLDSTSIAAMAACAGTAGVRTFTRGSASQTADPEPRLAALAAKSLALPHQVHDNDGDEPFADWERRPPFMPEPINEPYWAGKHVGRELVARHSRVLLVGEGADELLSPEFAVDLIGKVPLATLLRDSIRHWRRTGRRPPVGLRRLLRRWKSPGQQADAWRRPPLWINQELSRRLRQQERMRDFYASAAALANHPLRPSGVRHLNASMHVTRDGNDPGMMGLPLEWRAPFRDLRLMQFVYSLSPLYWCSGKRLLREAMAGYLPPEILQRSKTALDVGNRLNDPRAPWWDRFDPSADLASYVDLRELAKTRNAAKTGSPSLIAIQRDVRPLTLSHWLHANARRLVIQ